MIGDQKEEKLGKSSANLFYLSLVIAAFLLALVLIFSWNNSFYYDMQSYATSPSLAPLGSVKPAGLGRLLIDFGNGEKLAFEGEVRVGMTVLSALRAAESAGSFKILTDERGRVVEIDGVKNNSHRRWRALLNGSLVADPPGGTAISAGDKISFKYE